MRAALPQRSSDIRDWLYRYRFAIQDTPAPELHFRIAIIDIEQRRMVVPFRRDSPFVEIAALSHSGGRLEKLFSAHDEFVEDAGIQLGQLGIEYNLVLFPKPRRSPWN